MTEKERGNLCCTPSISLIDCFPVFCGSAPFGLSLTREHDNDNFDK